MARGGGSVEDLLPFSDETLCREIAACTTPVVSAIGHEPDSPLCDLVADVRAATPTDAAKRIVPDAVAEQALVTDLRRRSARALRNWVHREQHTVSQLRSRPVLAQPLAALTARAEEIHRARATARRDITRAHRVGDRPHRTPVGPTGHTGAGGDAGARVRRRADRVGFHGRYCGPSTTRRRAPGCESASPTAPSLRSARGQMKPISQLGYEQARDELIEVVRTLEQGGLDLDASLKLWERGEELAKRCEEHLAGAREKVEKALASRDDDES